MFRSWSVRISLLAVTLLVLGPLLALAGVLSGLAASMLFALAAAVGLVGFVAGLVTTFRGRVRPGVLAMALGAVCIGTVLLPVLSAGRPPINDISTDLQDVPAFVHAPTLEDNRGRDMGYPEAFKPTVRDFYSQLAPLRLEAPPQVVFERALAVARAQPRWEVTHVDPQARTFEGVVSSRIFGYRDDFVVRVRPEGAGSRVDMRSKSRVGRGDLGANAKRIEAFFRLLGRQGGG